MTVTLSDEQFAQLGRLTDVLADAVAVVDRVLEALQATPPAAPVAPFVGTAELAVALGRSTDYVRTHARKLGGRRLGSGPWNFPLEVALAAGTAPRPEPTPSPLSLIHI